MPNDTRLKTFKNGQSELIPGTLIVLDSSNLIQACGTTQRPMGITLKRLPPDTAGTVLMFGEVIEVAVSEAVVYGDLLYPAAAGKVQTVGEAPFAQALQAGGAGDVILAYRITDAEQSAADRAIVAELVESVTPQATLTLTKSRAADGDRGGGLYATIAASGADPGLDDGVLNRVIDGQHIRLVGELVTFEQAGMVGLDTFQAACANSGAMTALRAANLVAWDAMMAVGTNSRLTFRGDQYYPLPNQTAEIPSTFRSGLDMSHALVGAAATGGTAAENAAACVPVLRIKYRTNIQNQECGKWKIGALRQCSNFTGAGNAYDAPFMDLDIAADIDEDLVRGATPGAAYVNSAGDTLLETLATITDIGVLIEGQSGLDQLTVGCCGGAAVSVCVDVYDGSPFAWSNLHIRTQTNAALVQFLQRHTMELLAGGGASSTGQTWANECRIKILSGAGIPQYFSGSSKFAAGQSGWGFVQLGTEVVQSINTTKMPDHSAASAYSAGDYVMHRRAASDATTLWRCKANIGAKAFTLGDWDDVLVGMNAYYVELQDAQEIAPARKINGHGSAAIVAGSAKELHVERTRAEALTRAVVLPRWPDRLNRTKDSVFNLHGLINTPIAAESNYGNSNGEMNYFTGSDRTNGYIGSQPQWMTIIDEPEIFRHFWYDGAQVLRCGKFGQGYFSSNGSYTFGRPEDYTSYAAGMNGGSANQYSIRVFADRLDMSAVDFSAGNLRFRVAMPNTKHRIFRLTQMIRPGGTPGTPMLAAWETDSWDNATAQLAVAADYDWCFNHPLLRYEAAPARYEAAAQSVVTFAVDDRAQGLTIALKQFQGLYGLRLECLGPPHLGREDENDIHKLQQVWHTGATLPAQHVVTATPLHGQYKAGERRYLSSGSVIMAAADGWGVARDWSSGAACARGEWIHYSGRIYEITNATTVFGTTAPTHTTGSVSDGAATLLYLGAGAAVTWNTA